MRFWSPGAMPAGRMPGVTMSLPADSGRARRRAASRGEAMTPSAPAAKARRARSSDEVGEGAVADERGVEVGAVERGEDGDGEEAGRRVAAAFGGGGDHVRVAVDGEEVGGDVAARLRVAAATVAPMSKSFMSRKTRLPSALSARARSRPPVARRPRPTL